MRGGIDFIKHEVIYEINGIVSMRFEEHLGEIGIHDYTGASITLVLLLERVRESPGRYLFLENLTHTFVRIT